MKAVEPWSGDTKENVLGTCEEYKGGLDSGRMGRTLARVDNVD